MLADRVCVCVCVCVCAQATSLPNLPHYTRLTGLTWDSTPCSRPSLFSVAKACALSSCANMLVPRYHRARARWESGRFSSQLWSMCQFNGRGVWASYVGLASRCQRSRHRSQGILAESTGFQRSSRIASIADANCLLEIPKDQGTLPKGPAHHVTHACRYSSAAVSAFLIGRVKCTSKWAIY